MSENGPDQTAADVPIEEMRAFAALRGRPAVFLVLHESLDVPHLFRLQDALGQRQFDELDLVIHSGGGDINVAYQMVELIRLHTKRLIACVPLYAKSAATLLCLGADEMSLDKTAQLGPLDTQVYEKKKGGEGDFASALNPFKALEQLHSFSLDALDTSVRMFSRSFGLSLDECIQHAVAFVVGTTGPLFARLDPKEIGEYSRALAVAEEYGKRLLRRFTDWEAGKRLFVVDRLVHGYPSHNYIIDYHELEELGFNVDLLGDGEDEAAQRALLSATRAANENEESNALIALVEPTKPVKKTHAKEPKETPS